MGVIQDQSNKQQHGKQDLVRGPPGCLPVGRGLRDALQRRGTLLQRGHEKRSYLRHFATLVARTHCQEVHPWWINKQTIDKILSLLKFNSNVLSKLFLNFLE